MFWSSVVFILIKNQIFIFTLVGASSVDFLIAFDMTLVVFDSSFFTWYDAIFQTHIFSAWDLGSAILPRSLGSFSDNQGVLIPLEAMYWTFLSQCHYYWVTQCFRLSFQVGRNTYIYSHMLAHVHSWNMCVCIFKR